MAEAKKNDEATESVDSAPKAASRAKAASTKAAGTKAASTKAASSKAAGTKAAGTKAASSKAAGTKAGDSKAATADAATSEQAAAPAVRTLKLHHLRPAPGSNTPRTRVGRGEGSKGKTAGRGTKGTKARYQVPAGFEGGQMPMHMRLPKLRGFKNPFRTEYQVVNLDKLAALFPEGGAVTVADLVSAGAVRPNSLVKVLGTGDLGGVKLDITVDGFSASAKEKIEAAGGSATQA